MSLLTFGIGTAIGAGAGYLAAIFLAPGTGKENQRELEEKSKEIYQHAQEQGKEWAKQAQEQGQHLAQQAQEQGDKIAQQASESFNQIQEQVKDRWSDSNDSTSVVHVRRSEDDGEEITMKDDQDGLSIDITKHQ